MKELSDAAKAFLAAIASPDVAVRQAALKRLPPAQDAADALPGLADLMAGAADPAVAKAAKAAMEAVTHRALTPAPGKDKPDRAARERAAARLTEIADSSRPRMVRAHALCLLGFAGDGAHEKALALLEKDPEVGEDARMARQRIRSARY